MELNWIAVSRVSLTRRRNGLRDGRELVEIMIMRPIGFLLLCLVSFYPISGRAQSMQLVDLLFPQSIHWRTVNALPPLPPGFITENLAKTLWKNATLNSYDQPGYCGGAQALRSADFEKSAHLIKFNNETGLIFAGRSNCQEGDSTIIWPTLKPMIYQPHSLLFADKVQLLPGAVLKIDDTVKPGIVLFKPGCCGDPTDGYLSYDEGSYGSRLFWIVGQNLVLPQDITSTDTVEIIRQATELRSAPVINDSYDPHLSGTSFAEGAVFGNVERRYLPGAAFTVIGLWKDQNGNIWQLVTADETTNRPLSYYTRAGVNVGWIALPKK